MNITNRILMTAVLLILVGQVSYGQAVGFDDYDNNTALGANSLTTVFNLEFSRDVGSAMGNTAVGAQTLAADSTGSYNTAVGSNALANDTADFNTAVGSYAMYSNTTGTENTALGGNALYTNIDGSLNTAVGQNALFLLGGGNYNTAVGGFSLSNAAGTSYNIALGYAAGVNITGSDNIDIGNVGVAGEQGTIRIGTPGTNTSTTIAGISATPLTGAAVYVTSDGQLGVLASSQRYKTAIAPLNDDWSRLARLQPVTFHLKAEPRGPLQYGLIAEEVDKIYPELVIRDTAGAIQGIRYDELAPMLLEELQKRREYLAAAAAANAAQATRIRVLQQQVSQMQALRAALRTALAQLPAKDDLVARR